MQRKAIFIPAVRVYDGKTLLKEKTDYAISCKNTVKANDVKKGTASVTIKGPGNYGGTKTVKFTIKAKGFLWWWKN